MNFEAEISKFKPSLEIDEVQDAVYAQKTEDVVDIIQSIISEHTSSGNSAPRRR
ncbi:MAG: hypothetical protein K6G11_10230 [Lachnospiraceae bacterium]|nr:hypothetical protein [Lachnospiraceae bacterium]